MADHFQRGRLNPTTPNPQFSSHLGFRLNFSPLSSPFPLPPYPYTPRKTYIPNPRHRWIPPPWENIHLFKSRLSTTFLAYLCGMVGYKGPYHGKPTSTWPKHRWIPPPRENIQLFKSRLSTTFPRYLCRMVGPRGPYANLRFSYNDQNLRFIIYKP